MSQDVVINGTTYPGVESISLQDGDGNIQMYFPNAVRYVPQTLTDEQKAQARENIGAVSPDEITDAVNDSLPEYWENYLPDKIAAIKSLQDAGGKDAFSFIVITDIHYPQNLGKRSPAIAKRIMDECNIKYVLSLADHQSRAQWSTKEGAESDWAGVREMFKPIAENVLYQRGNHDGSWGNALNGTTYPYNFTQEELYNRVYAPVYKYHDAVTDESGTGYYVDDTARKVRYIMLNNHCNSYEENEDGSAKYNNMSTARFTQSQYDMLIDALNTVKEGWAIVIGAHVPLIDAYKDAWGGADGDYLIMRNLLKAYKDKTTYKANWAGTAGGGSGGYTNLFSASGSGFDNQTSKFYTNWLPYNGNDNGGTGTIYHFKGISTGQPYKMNFAMDANGSSATAQFYCTNASVQPPKAADYDSSVIVVQHHTPEYTHVRFEIRQALPENLIITANEPIVESTGGSGYDAVSIDADFTGAKGDLIGYFCGHMHNDYMYDAKNWWGVSIITTRCDGAVENDSTLLAQRVEGTTTEQSFDVFTVNRKTGKLYATKIGAGADRVTDY